MQTNQIEPQLQKITKQFLTELEAERAALAITSSASLERELGIDSLGKIELFRRIEKEFSIHLPERAMIEADSLKDLAKIIQQTAHYEPAEQKSSHNFAPTLDTAILDVSKASSLVELIQLYGEKEPNRPHIYFQNENGEENIITYGDLYSAAKEVANGLIKLNIMPGATVAIMLPTSEQFFYSFFGVLLAGCIPVAIYPPFRPNRIEEYAKREARILQNANVKVLITFDEAKFLSRLIKNFIPCLQKVTTVEQLRKSASSHPLNLPVKSTDIVFIQYTSGSTGDPKGVTITHENMLANMRAIGKAMHIHPTDVAVSWLPLYHDMGLMTWLGALYFGAPITILSPITFMTRPERWLWAIHYHRGTLSGGPNFAYELCIKKIDPSDIKGLDLSSWRYALNGAEAVNPKTIEEFHKKFAPYGFQLETFSPVYGLAEATVGLTFPPHRRPPLIDKINRSEFENNKQAISVSDSASSLSFVGCGVPLENHDVRIVDDSGAIVGDRIVGNIQFCGPSAMQGYYNNPEKTKKIFHDGWWETGDMGYKVGDELFITGRKKDLIIKAGRNITPEEIEDVVNQVAKIRKGCVVAFGVSDANVGTEKIIIVAETYDLTKAQQTEVRSAIIEKLVSALGVSPDLIILAPPKTILKTSSGKLQRSACKEAFIQGKLTKPPVGVSLQLGKLAIVGLYKKLKQFTAAIGKAFYSLYLFVLLVISVPLLWLVTLFSNKKIVMSSIRRFSKLFIRASGCSMAVQDKARLESSKPMIYIANHASYIDSLVLLSILPKNVSFVGKQELLKMPIVRSFLKKLSFIAVDRTDFSQSVKSKTNIEAHLNQGKSVVIFPEGTFTYATGLRPFKLGAFKIAAETGVSICPIAIHGTRDILRGNEVLATPGKIKVTIGEPIAPEANDWNETTRLHNLARAEISQHCGEPIIELTSAAFKQEA